MIALSLEPTPAKVISSLRKPPESNEGSFVRFFHTELVRYEREGRYNTVGWVLP